MSSTTAFGANLLGAMVGGALEYLALILGFNALLVVVAVCYSLALLTGRKHLVPVRWARSDAGVSAPAGAVRARPRPWASEHGCRDADQPQCCSWPRVAPVTSGVRSTIGGHGTCRQVRRHASLAGPVTQDDAGDQSARRRCRRCRLDTTAPVVVDTVLTADVDGRGTGRDDGDVAEGRAHDEPIGCKRVISMSFDGSTLAAGGTGATGAGRGAAVTGRLPASR